MTIQRMMQLLSEWQHYMTYSSNKLGYPSKSLGVSTGVGNSNFDEMCDNLDVANSRHLDVIIDGLPLLQKQAVHYKHEIIKFWNPIEDLSHHYDIATESLCKIAQRRGII